MVLLLCTATGLCEEESRRVVSLWRAPVVDVVVVIVVVVEVVGVIAIFGSLQMRAFFPLS